MYNPFKKHTNQQQTNQQQNPQQVAQQQTIIVQNNNTDVLRKVSEINYKLDQISLTTVQEHRQALDNNVLNSIIDQLSAFKKSEKEVSEDKCTLAKNSLPISDSKIFKTKDSVAQEFKTFFMQLKHVQSLNILFENNQELLEVNAERVDKIKKRTSKEALKNHNNEIGLANALVEDLQKKLKEITEEVKKLSSAEFKETIESSKEIFNLNQAVIKEYCKFCSIEEEEADTLQYYALCSVDLENQLLGSSIEE